MTEWLDDQMTKWRVAVQTIDRMVYFFTLSMFAQPSAEQSSCYLPAWATGPPTAARTWPVQTVCTVHSTHTGMSSFNVLISYYLSRTRWLKSGNNKNISIMKNIFIWEPFKHCFDLSYVLSRCILYVILECILFSFLDPIGSLVSTLLVRKVRYCKIVRL